jgi:hypothetical protein
MTKKKKKIIVIRNLNDVLDLQVLRWKKKFPDAEEPEEWGDNEIRPDEEFDASEEISEVAAEVIKQDAMERQAALRDAFGDKAGSGLYVKGYGRKGRADAPEVDARVKQAEEDEAERYAARLKAAGDAMSKEFDLGDEYEIVFEGEYAKTLLAGFKEDEGSKVDLKEEIAEAESHGKRGSGRSAKGSRKKS